jgi:hypothetical protein
MGKLGRLWRGELALGDVFWNWAVIGGLAVNITTSLAFLALISSGQAIAALVVGYLFSVPYNILVGVGVWRSAARYEGPRRHAELARLVSAIGLTLLSLT